MKYLFGLATGIVIGIAGAIAYSIMTGTDLRELAKDVRSDIDKVDVSAVGKAIDVRMATIEAAVVDRINELRGVEAEPETPAAAPGAGTPAGQEAAAPEPETAPA